MATILLNRHSGTERPATSEYTLFSDLESILSTKHDVIRVPSHESWSDAALEAWIVGKALGADLMIGNDYRILKSLRRYGWMGKVIYKALGDLPHGASGLRSALPYLYKTDAVWCSSTADEHIYEMLVAQDGYAPRAVLLPYGIDCGMFTPLSASSRKRLRRTWGLDADDFVVVYAGRITIEKNVHSVLEVVRHLLRTGARIKLAVATRVEDVPFRQLHMYGRGLDAKIQRLIEQLDLSEHVRLLPWLDHSHLNELHNVGDVFVNLTLATGENFGYAQVEAMSAGLPVVATAWGGLRDTIIEGRTGFQTGTWVSERGIRFDMPKVVSALRALMNDLALRRWMSAQAVRHVRRQYSWPVYSSRLFRLIDDMLSVPTQISDANLTEFGASFHSRFSARDKGVEEAISRYPVYECLSDPHYMRLIEPYTSWGRAGFAASKDVFKALSGSVDGGFFHSADLLWPARIPVDQDQARVVRLLSRYQTLNSQFLDCPAEVIRTLIKKGLVGASDTLSVSTTPWYAPSADPISSRDRRPVDQQAGGGVGRGIGRGHG